MAKQGPSLGFQHVEVPIHSLSNDTMLAPLDWKTNSQVQKPLKIL
jgi:hypothetical protein